MKTKKVSLGDKKFVVVRSPTGGEVTKTADMTDRINELYRDDIEKHADEMTKLNYKTLAWCVTEHNLFDGKKEDMDLAEVLMNMPAGRVKKINDTVTGLVGGDIGKKS